MRFCAVLSSVNYNLNAVCIFIATIEGKLTSNKCSRCLVVTKLFVEFALAIGL